MAEAVNANTQMYDRVIDRAAMIRMYEDRVQGKVTLTLDGHEKRLDDLVRAARTDVKGLDRLREAVDQELQRTYQEAHAVTKRSLVDLAVDQLSFAYQNVEVAMGPIWRTARPTRRVAEEIALERPLYEDRTLSQGWAGVSLSERKRLDALIRRGVAQGWTVDEIALEVRRGNVHNITRMQARTLVTTAVTSVHNQADHEVYKANAKALQGWQYVAVLDSRTTSLCAHRDGHIYPIGDVEHLPPAHWNCRSTSVPVFKSWEDIANLEGAAEVRKRNLRNLTPEERAFYDGLTPAREGYEAWLKRQPVPVQLRHLGEYKKVEMLNAGELSLDKFTKPDGATLGIRELRKLTDQDAVVPGDTRRFANAKARLDAMRLGASTPEDLYKMQGTLVDYYLLQAGDLNGNLAVTSYRGTLLHNKRNTRNRVLSSPPTEEQLRYNPLTQRYDDVRIYQPNADVYDGALRRVRDSEDLLQGDKDFVLSTLDKLSMKMGMNERAAVADNLRVTIGRFRKNGEVWGNFKAVSNSQMKFDVMNVSDAIETQLRRDGDVLRKLSRDVYVDPVLGETQLSELGGDLVKNIKERNRWDDTVAPAIARELRDYFDLAIPKKIRSRLSERQVQGFYQRFAERLGAADSPDRDALAVALGRDLYNSANYNGNRRDWYNLGLKLLEQKAGHLFQIDTFGVQKRRMRSRLSGAYFGPYYDTVSYYIKVEDPRIVRYARLNRQVEIGLRVPVTSEGQRLTLREGYKTYFVRDGLGWYDTRLPIVSSSSFSNFPTEFVDKDFVSAMNWASETKYKIDPEFHEFIRKLLYFKDDRGNAKKYDELNHYRKYMLGRGDAYEHFKTMQWLTEGDRTFSNHTFIDMRGRVYSRGFVTPQSGESFRPFFNTERKKPLGEAGHDALVDQIGSFLGGLTDYFEGNFDSLTFVGRRRIAEKWRPELRRLGQAMLSGKPADMRYVLESPVVAQVDGEELGKFFRFAMEVARIDGHLQDGGTLGNFYTALAMEQDASSSGAQIIALTTRNKQLAGLSNVVPTNQKRRLYDEIAAATYNDPRFKVLNERLGLKLKDLQKAAKAQNMVTFYGAGEKTGILNVEGKLGKVLNKREGTLVVTASDRQKVLNEIDARIARVERYDPEGGQMLRVLRQDVRDIFNKGQDPGDDIMESLYFLDPATKELVEKLTRSYEQVVTPDDFKGIAKIMSEHLAEQVPILKDFTRFFGRLARAYLETAKPANADFDWKKIATLATRGSERGRAKLPPLVAETLGLPANTPVTEQLLSRLFTDWNPNSGLAQLVFGAKKSDTRAVGRRLWKLDLGSAPDIASKYLGTDVLKDATKASEVSLLYTDQNDLPKSWSNVPWVNFDGKTIEQNFTQSFEERLVYKDKEGNWITNILMIPQKTEASYWDQVLNKAGSINDIADAGKANTAFAVNGNHSNDAVIVKRFHLWGRDNNVPTSTVHDAFFTHIADLLPGRTALRGIYAKTLDKNVVKMTLDEMRARGLSKELYDAFLDEAIDKGLIPVAGRSVVGGKVLAEEDILTQDDVLEEVPYDFERNYGWYGVG